MEKYTREGMLSYISEQPRRDMSKEVIFEKIEKMHMYFDMPCMTVLTWKFAAHTACLLDGNACHVDLLTEEECESLEIPYRK